MAAPPSPSPNCSSPTRIANGYVSFDSLANGPTWADGVDVKYKCFKYYGLVNTNKLTCSTGNWIGTLPKCEYHQNTEIVFWLVLALVILLLLLLLALIIFLCCYFCRCCKRAANRKRKSSKSSDKQHNDEYSEENECGNSRCNKVCSGTEIEDKPYKNRDHSKSLTRSRSNSPHRSKKEEWSCCGCCWHSKTKTKTKKNDRRNSPAREEPNNYKKEKGTTSKSRCCFCCRSKQKNQVEDGHNSSCVKSNDPRTKELDTLGKSFSRYEKSTIDSTINQPVAHSTTTVHSAYFAGPEKDFKGRANNKITNSYDKIELENKRQRDIELFKQEEKEEKYRLKQKKRELQNDQEGQREREQFEREYELTRLQDENDRKLREEETIRNDYDDKLKREKAEQQQRYEDDMVGQRDDAEKEREKELFEFQQQQDVAQQKEQNKDKALKRVLEEKEREHAEQQRNYEDEIKKEREITYHKDIDTKNNKAERQMNLINSNDKYVKGLIDGDIGKKGTRNPQVYSPRRLHKPTKVAAAEGDVSDRARSTKKYVHHEDKPERKRPLKLINSNDKYMRGIMDDSIGKKATNNPFVYRPFKIEKPKFDTSD